MSRANRQVPRRHWPRVAIVLGVVLLSGCGDSSNPDSDAAEQETSANAADVVRLDLTGVSFEVRRDPG